MKLNVVHLIQQVSLFFNIMFMHIDKLVPFWHKFEDYCGQNHSLEFTSLHKDSFSLPHYCGVSRLPGAASVNYDDLFFKINFYTHTAYTSAPDVLN